MSKQITTQSLRKFNLIMAGLHFAQGALMLWLTETVAKGREVFELTGSYLSFDVATETLSTANAKVGISLDLAYVVILFLFLSAGFHFLIATVFNKMYNRDLKMGVNKLRWIEYSLSASTMIVAISLLVGVYDAMSLFMMFMLVAIMNLCGLIMEIHNLTTKKTNWLSYWIGCLAGIIPWLVIVFYFWMADVNAVGDAKTPAFVYGIFISIFTFFNLFAINMVLQYKKIGPWKNYLYGERVYIILSLVAKSLLAWQVYSGVFAP